MQQNTSRWIRRCRTIFISDVHLGTRGCRADLLLEFLSRHQCRELYLIGDIIDGWRLKKNWFWDASHSAVVQHILKLAQNGTTVTYIPGNHDEFARSFHRLELGAIRILNETVHEAADGRRYLVLHGDGFDCVIKYARWLALAGDWAYRTCLSLNRHVNHVRAAFGKPYWSLSAYLKRKVKNAVAFIGDFEHAIVEEARRRDVDGVICGHIHHAALREIDGVVYCNDGDWVESCTALVENFDGRMEIVHWVEERNRAPLQVAMAS
jgi:UDP-2,3-diacylglucosamine pyrophosphatase LpxH